MHFFYLVHHLPQDLLTIPVGENASALAKPLVCPVHLPCA